MNLTNEQREAIYKFAGWEHVVKPGFIPYWLSPERGCYYYGNTEPPIDLNFFGKWVMVNPGIRGYSIAKLHRYDNRILKMAIIETTKLFEYKIYSNFDHKAKDEGLTLDDVDALKSALVKLVSEHSTITLRK